MLDFSRRTKGFNTPSGKLDFDKTAQALCSRALAVCQHLLPHGRKEGNEWRVGDLHGAKGQSLGVHLTGADAGLWKDFSAGIGGADLIALWAAVKGLKQGEAKQEADEWLGLTNAPARSASVQIRHHNSHQLSEELSPRSSASQEQIDASQKAGADTSEWRKRAPDLKWDYRNADGSYFGTVYRWQIDGGKIVRPWDGHDYKAPEALRPPLYLPELIAAPAATVILVEGEKKCDRLRRIGYQATSLWGGSQAVARTDWSTLAGRDVVVWPDNDAPGKAFVKYVTAALQESGVGSVRVAAIPHGRAEAWDADDASDDEAHAILKEALEAKPCARGYRPMRLTEWMASTAYAGDPPPRRYLVNEVFPLGVACGLAAQGDTGKGMLLLDLANKVAARQAEGTINTAPPIAFGGTVSSFGTAVILSAEDDQGELHRRLAAMPGLFHTDDRLIVVPLPNFGGAPALFKNEGGSVDTTDAWDDLLAQLTALQNLRLVVLDPLASFVRADVNADPGIGAFVCGRFAAMADTTGATVLVAQHMAKGNQSKPITTAEEARHAIRGTSALVDNMRATYALWPTHESQARRVCESFGVPWSSNAVVSGAVVKSNGPADRAIRTYLRNRNTGLLEDITARALKLKAPAEEIMDMLVDEIRRAAVAGCPFTASGANGLFARKEEMGEPDLQVLSRDDFSAACATLIRGKRILPCHHPSRARALDVPRGPFATGSDEDGYPPIIERGARKDLRDMAE